jgi:hypothetical protein
MLFIFYGVTELHSQKPPCDTTRTELSYRDYKLLDYQVPPVNVENMPEYVKNAYLRFDNFSRTTNYNEFQKFLNSQNGLTDSLRKIMADFYNIIDYDPILFWFYMLSKKVKTYSFPPYSSFTQIVYGIKKKSSNPFFDYQLLDHDYILHVKILDKFITDNHYIIVTTEILDTIKGKIIPNCKDITYNDTSSFKDTFPRKNIAKPGECFQFNMQNQQSDPYGNVYAYPFDEYIVFCGVYGICGGPGHVDTSDVFTYYGTFERYYLNNFNNQNFHYDLLPVSNGKVIDPSNTWGFGDSCDVSFWKEKVRQRINEIKNAEPSSIEKNSYSNETTIFPNPTNLTLNFHNLPQNSVKYEIYNSIGVKVSEGVISDDIDISNLQIGVYYIKVNSLSKPIKFIKY